MGERPNMPTVMYRARRSGVTELRAFDHPDDIPPGQGWYDNPSVAAANVWTAARRPRAGERKRAPRPPAFFETDEGRALLSAYFHDLRTLVAQGLADRDSLSASGLRLDFAVRAARLMKATTVIAKRAHRRRARPAPARSA